MNVMYTCDDNYIWLMGISVISLFENNRHIKFLDVYLLGEHITTKNKEIIYGIAHKYNRKIIVIDVPRLDIPEILISARWPMSAFTRLFSGELLPLEIDRVLYLDCDTIVKGSIESLEILNIDRKLFYGVKDCISRAYKCNLGMKSRETYINAGVLLINMTRLRKIDITSVAEKYMKEYSKLVNYADQDILNGMLRDQIGILEPQYNVMTINVAHTYKEIMALRKPVNFYTEAELVRAAENPVIIHYTTNMRIIRPWYLNTNHPLAKEFIKYMEISPWKDKELPKMAFNTLESKIICGIQKFPPYLSCKLLGIIHSELKPLYIRLKATTLFCIKKGK